MSDKKVTKEEYLAKKVTKEEYSHLSKESRNLILSYKELKSKNDEYSGLLEDNLSNLEQKLSNDLDKGIFNVLRDVPFEVAHRVFNKMVDSYLINRKPIEDLKVIKDLNVLIKV